MRATGRAATARRPSCAAATNARPRLLQCPNRGRDSAESSSSWRISDDRGVRERRGRYERDDDDRPPARANSLRIEAVPGIPREVPHAVRQMVEEAKRPADERYLEPPGAVHTRDCVERIGSHRESDQPHGERDGAERKKETRDPMQA